MAERNQRKFADNSDFHANDPFAELTRIMGFDPRVANMAPSAGKQEDDLGIDLERELMGEFEAADSAPEPAVPLQPAPFALAARQDEAPEDAAAEAAFDPSDLDPADLDPADLDPSELDLDGEFTAALEAGIAGSTIDDAGEADALVGWESETDAFDLATDPAAEPIHAADASAIAAAEFVAEDEALSDEMPAAAPLAHEAADDFAADDLALVDMDFLDAPEPASAAEPVQAWTSGEPHAAVDASEPALAEADLSLEDELSMLLSHDAPEATAASEPSSDIWTAEELEDQPVLEEIEAVGDVGGSPAFAESEDAGQPVAEASDDWMSVSDREEIEAQELDLEGLELQQDDAPVADLDLLIDEPADGEQAFEAPVEAAPGFPEQCETVEPVDEAPVSERSMTASDEPDAGDETDEAFQPFVAEPVVDDPFAELAAMAAAPSPVPARPRLSLATPVVQAPGDAASEIEAVSPAFPSEPLAQPASAWPSFSRSIFTAPIYEADAETVDVPDKAIAVADDLDIPELDVAEVNSPVASDFDDLDVDIAAGLDDFRPEEPAQAFEPAREHLADDFPEAADGEITLDADDAVDDDYSRDLRPIDYRSGDYAAAGAVAAGAAYAGTRGHAEVPQQSAWRDAAHQPSAYARTAHDQDFAELTAEDFEFDPAAEQEAQFPPHEENHAPDRRRALWVAGLIAGVAAIGAIGAFAVSFGGGEASAPTIVRADTDPVKVKPENPGGTTVPNQNNPVYDSVAGAAAADSPSQERLLSGAEEPVDMAAQAAPPVAAADSLPALDGDAPEMAPEMASEPIAAEIAAAESAVPPESAATETADALPGVELPEAVDATEMVATAPLEAASKNEERVLPAETVAPSANEDIVAVAPRRVKTMVVRPDGTMVPREEPAAPEPAEPRATSEAAVLDAPAAAAPAPQPRLPQAETANAPAPAPAAAPRDIAAAPSERPVAEPAVVQPQSRAAASQTPATVPVAPSRPSEQPVDIVGEVREPQVAAIEPPAQPAAAGGWTMQIASQPTPEGAQSSYQDLARRYGSVIGGRGVNIVKADIAGKGTFYRVRVPAGSRNDAINLCEKYKSAGGSCFVSR